MNLNARFSVANKDGGNGINFRDALDPRVPWARVPANRLGFDKATPQFDQGHYFNESAPIPIATGVEARLIEAEAALGRWGRDDMAHHPQHAAGQRRTVSQDVPGGLSVAADRVVVPARVHPAGAAG